MNRENPRVPHQLNLGIVETDEKRDCCLHQKQE